MYVILLRKIPMHCTVYGVCMCVCLYVWMEWIDRDQFAKLIGECDVHAYYVFMNQQL